MSRALADLSKRFLGAFLATLLLAPLFGLLLPQTPFHRVTTRVFLVALIVAFVVRRGHPSAWPARLAALGLCPPHRARRFALGAATGIALLSLLLLVSWLLGGREPLSGPYRIPFLRHILGSIVAGVAVGFVEEILCRGYLKEVLGGAASAAVYSGVHFLRPQVTSDPAPAAYDPLLVFRRFGDLTGGWRDPQSATLGFLSLFLFGLALNRLRERTGSLYLGIGLHAGLVFALDFYRRFLSSVAVGAGPWAPWIFGGPRLHDGLLGTALMAVLLVAAHKLPSPRRP